MKDPFVSCLSAYVNGEKATGILAVDTDAGIAYGYALDTSGPFLKILKDEAGELIYVIHRGTVELRPDDQGFSDPGRLYEVEVFLSLWAKEGGTPLAQFEEYVKPWQHLISAPSP